MIDGPIIDVLFYQCSDDINMCRVMNLKVPTCEKLILENLLLVYVGVGAIPTMEDSLTYILNAQVCGCL